MASTKAPSDEVSKKQEVPDDPDDESEFERYQGVTLCRKHVLIIRNYGRHDIETIKLMMQDLKSTDEAKRRLAPRTLWIAGYGGNGGFQMSMNAVLAGAGATFEDGRPAQLEGADDPILLRNYQDPEDPRNKLLFWHQENRRGNITLYITDDQDSNKLYNCGIYMFTGHMLGSSDEESDVAALAEKLGVTAEERSAMRIRENNHFRFYLGPEPPTHPDFWNNGEDPRSKIGTVKMNYDKNGPFSFVDLEAS